MNSEFKTLRVNPVGQWLEALSICRRRKSVRDRNQNPVVVPEVFFLFDSVSEGVGHVPTLVDYRVLPAVTLHARQHPHIGFVVGFIDREAIGVPAIPTHGRGGRGLSVGAGGWGGDGGRGGEDARG